MSPFLPLARAGLCVLLFAPLLAQAAECAGSTQTDLNECTAAEARRADAAMNAAYAELMKRIGPTAQAALRAAQKAWLPFRDASCALEAMGAAGGSMQPMIRSGCLARVTAERTKTLDRYLTCEEGDAGCVGRFSE